MRRDSRNVLVALAAATWIAIAGGALLYVVEWPSAASCRATTSLSVRSYGAKGDGKADDTRAFVVALRVAAKSHRRLLVPAGVYRLRSLRVPDGVELQGAGRNGTWLKGRLTFGSDQVITDLKIGDAGDCAVHNAPGATNTLFQRCRFRGGGGAPGYEKSPVVALGYDGDVSHVTFRGCEVERNLGTENDYFTNGCNDVTIYVGSAGRQVNNITFDACHIGVSNGVATGSPRMGVECWMNDDVATVGYHDISLKNCIVEACDIHCLDFSDSGSAPAHDILVEGCTIWGGGKAVGATKWGDGIDLEFPTRVTIRNNTFYRCKLHALSFSDHGWSHAAGSGRPGTVIAGNTFDLDTDNGVPAPITNPILLIGDGISFTGNTIYYHGTQEIVGLATCTNATVTGNTFYKASETNAIVVWDGSDNTIAPNNVQ